MKNKIQFSAWPNLDLNDSTNLLNLYQNIISLSNVYFPFSISIRLFGLYATCSEMIRRNYNKGMLFVFVLIIINIFVAGVCKYFFAKYFGALGLTELWAEGRPIWASLSVWEQDQESGRPTRGPRPIWAQSRKCN